jgi:hypothetical protein
VVGTVLMLFAATMLDTKLIAEVVVVSSLMVLPIGQCIALIVDLNVDLDWAHQLHRTQSNC